MKQANGIWFPDIDTHFASFVANGSIYQKDVMDLAFSVGGYDRGIAIDVGAHVGLWAAELGKIYNRVYAFEPQEDNFECLVKNSTENVICYRQALGSIDGYAQEVINPIANSGAYYFTATRRKTPTRMLRLDSVRDVAKEKIDFIKVDIQGGEMDFLFGAEKTIKRNHPLIVLEVVLNDKIDYRPIGLLAEWGASVLYRTGSDRIFGWSVR